jgi:acetolactate synthase-1/2/3 large subunit
VSTPASYITIPSIGISQLLMKYLQLEGVTKIFGVPGATFVDLLNQLKDNRATMQYVVCKHETGAGYMADGYHRASGKLGVVLVTSGPGATNALTGAMNAQAGRTSMLVITGEQSQLTSGLDSEQEGVDLDLDVLQVYKSAVGYSTVINNPNDFDVLFRQALRDALAVPGQTAHVSVPHDIMASTITNVRFPTSTALYRRTIDSAASSDIQAVASLLVAAKRPMILLGNGTRDALDAAGLAKFQSFVERFGIPVGTTSDAKALFAESHALSLRSCGYPPCQWPALYFAPPTGSPNAAPYDFLLVLGSSMGDFATNLWDPVMVPAGPFIQVDADERVIGRSMPITMGVIAEAGAFLNGLTDLAAGLTPDTAALADRLAYLKWMKANNSAYADPKARESDATPIRPERAMAIVSEMIPPGSHIFPDAGNSCGWTSHYLALDPPTRIHPALDVGAMGYATAAVVGAKIAAPEATCLSIGGDGSFLMHGSEVSTARQYGAGAIWMVWSENDLNMVAQGMAAYFPDPVDKDVWKDYYKLGNPDLVKVAEGLGADAYLVHSPADLQDALGRAISGGQQGRPQVIVVREDPSARPPFKFPPKPAK